MAASGQRHVEGRCATRFSGIDPGGIAQQHLQDVIFFVAKIAAGLEREAMAGFGGGMAQANGKLTADVDVAFKRPARLAHLPAELVQDRARDPGREIADEQQLRQALQRVADAVGEGGCVAIGEDQEEMLTAPRDIVFDVGIEV
ncbi:hypothetical protein AY520_11430 [Corynebacterium diphtheriae bv. mitis]|nr:hypothetical protein AY520_11430 [Corynebacterium diphtheriae bv. mitis]